MRIARIERGKIRRFLELFWVVVVPDESGECLAQNTQMLGIGEIEAEDLRILRPYALRSTSAGLTIDE